MRVLYTNGWMYAIELEEPTSVQPGRYFLGNKVRGYVTTDLEVAMSTMQIPEVPKGETVRVPDDIQESIDLAIADEEAAAEGRRSKSEMHQHISTRHTERHPFWPTLVHAVKSLLGKEDKDSNTASIEEIYGRYI